MHAWVTPGIPRSLNFRDSAPGHVVSEPRSTRQVYRIVTDERPKGAELPRPIGSRPPHRTSSRSVPMLSVSSTRLINQLGFPTNN